MKELAGKVAVITGAGSGFGREFARQGAKLGLKLVLADIEQEALELLQTELLEQGAEVLIRHTDVSKASEVEALAEAAMRRFGVVHLLFNNAGVAFGGLIWESAVEDWEWVLGVNLWGTIHGLRVFTPLLLRLCGTDPNYSGHIINTASVAGLLSPPAMGVYSVSKHAVVALSETLYHDLRSIDARVSVSLLCPAYVPTGIARSQRNRPPELVRPEPPTRSQIAAQAHSQQAVDSGKLSAAEVAALTFAAIRDDRFYILSHPAILPAVQQRHADIASQRNPTDPAAAKPPRRWYD